MHCQGVHKGQFGSRSRGFALGSPGSFPTRGQKVSQGFLRPRTREAVDRSEISPRSTGDAGPPGNPSTLKIVIPLLVPAEIIQDLCKFQLIRKALCFRGSYPFVPAPAELSQGYRFCVAGPVYIREPVDAG